MYYIPGSEAQLQGKGYQLDKAYTDRIWSTIQGNHKNLGNG